MTLQPIQYLFWAISFLSYLVLATTMLSTGSIRKYPSLFAMAFFEMVLAIVLFNLRGITHYPQYFYVYWAIAPIIRMVLGFGIMFDIARAIPGTRYIPRRIWRLFVGVSAAITVAVVLVSYGTNPQLCNATGTAIEVTKCLYIAWCVFALSLFSQMGVLGLGWTSTPLMVANGFLIGTVISLTSSYAVTKWPNDWHYSGRHIDLVASFLLVFIWAYWSYAMGKETTDPIPSPELLEAARVTIPRSPHRQ